MAVTMSMALPPPIQTYFVPIREGDLIKPGLVSDGGDPSIVEGDFEIISGRSSTDDSPVTSLISVAVAAPGTIVYYDHWEDGYELDLTNPVQSTTQIWGDGDSGNGVAPGTTNDVFSGGESFILSSTVPVDRTTTDFYFDGSDQISASFPIALTRAAYPTDTGPFLAGATEVFDTDAFGDTFILPVGAGSQDLTSAFELTSAHVMAANAGTDIYVNGVFQETIAQAGGTAVLSAVNDGSGERPIGVGDVITTYDPAAESSGPASQVHLVTGDVGSTYEVRWYALQPRDQWSSEYYTPTFTGPAGDGDLNSQSGSGPSQVLLFNPGEAPLTVRYEFANGAGTVDIPAKGTGFSPIIPDQSGARFFTDNGEVFFGISVTDTSGKGDRNDWGHPLIPADQLTSQAIVGLGFGNEPQIDGSNNGSDRSAVWVAATEDGTTVHVDFDGNGTVEDTITIDRLTSVRLTDAADNDMSGAIIFATDPNGNPVDIAVSYGQDSAATPPANFNGNFEGESLDFGTVVPPLPELEASKNVTLKIDADGDGRFSPGDTVTYSITVLNFGRVDIAAGGYTVDDEGVPVFDLAVEGDGLGPLTYVGGSTRINPTVPNGNDIISDEAGQTAFPLDGDGYRSEAILGAQTSHVITFDAVIKAFDDLPAGTVDFTNEGALENNNGGLIDTFDVTRPLAFESGIDIEKSTNGIDADTLGEGPQLADGSVVTWTYVVTNTGETHLADVAVSDDQVATITYKSGDADGDSILDPNETWVFEATGTAIDGAYRNEGSVTANAVYANGTTLVPEAVGGGTVTDMDPSHYTGVPNNPSLAFDKTVMDVAGKGPSGVVVSAGDVITYGLVVTNDGNVPLTGVMVDDDLLGVSELVGDLAVGETKAVTATYSVTQADIDGNGIDALGRVDGDGDIDNVATADSDQTGPREDSEDVAIEQSPAIAIVKTVDTKLVESAGTTVTYTYVVTNEGNVSLSNVKVTDDNATPGKRADDFVLGAKDLVSGDTDGDRELDVDETWTFEADVTITRDQFRAGDPIVNVAVVTTDDGPTAEDDATVDVGQRAPFCTDIEPFDRPGRKEATEVGTRNDDALNGTNGKDVIFGRAGNDALSGNEGKNTLVGQGGNDVINGGNARDIAFGDNGRDILNGNGGRDFLDGGRGNDNIYGGGGRDVILGGGGRDLVEAGAGGDRINLGAGNDTVQGEGGHDCIAGGADTGRIRGNDNKGYTIKLGDELWGNGGKDTFEYSAGDGVDFIFDMTENSGDILRIRDYDLDDAEFITGMTPYGEFGGIVFERENGRLEGIFFQQAQSAEEVASWVDDGIIQFL